MEIVYSKANRIFIILAVSFLCSFHDALAITTNELSADSKLMSQESGVDTAQVVQSKNAADALSQTFATATNSSANPAIQKSITLPDGTVQSFDSMARLIQQISNDARKTTLDLSYNSDGSLAFVGKSYGVPAVNPQDSVVINFDFSSGTATETLKNGTSKTYQVSLQKGAPILKHGDEILASWQVMAGSAQFSLVCSLTSAQGPVSTQEINAFHQLSNLTPVSFKEVVVKTPSFTNALPRQPIDLQTKTINYFDASGGMIGTQQIREISVFSQFGDVDFELNFSVNGQTPEQSLFYFDPQGRLFIVMIGGTGGVGYLFPSNNSATPNVNFFTLDVAQMMWGALAQIASMEVDLQGTGEADFFNFNGTTDPTTGQKTITFENINFDRHFFFKNGALIKVQKNPPVTTSVSAAELPLITEALGGNAVTQVTSVNVDLPTMSAAIVVAYFDSNGVVLGQQQIDYIFFSTRSLKSQQITWKDANGNPIQKTLFQFDQSGKFTNVSVSAKTGIFIKADQNSGNLSLFWSINLQGPDQTVTHLLHLASARIAVINPQDKTLDVRNLTFTFTSGVTTYGYELVSRTTGVRYLFTDSQLVQIILPDGTIQNFDSMGRVTQQIANDARKTTLTFSYITFTSTFHMTKIVETFGIPSTNPLDLKQRTFDLNYRSDQEILNNGTIRFFLPVTVQNTSQPVLGPNESLLLQWSVGPAFYSITGLLRTVALPDGTIEGFDPQGRLLQKTNGTKVLAIDWSSQPATATTTKTDPVSKIVTKISWTSVGTGATCPAGLTVIDSYIIDPNSPPVLIWAKWVSTEQVNPDGSKVVVFASGKTQVFNSSGQITKQVLNDAFKTTLLFSYDSTGNLSQVIKTFGMISTNNPVADVTFDLLTGIAKERFVNGTIRQFPFVLQQGTPVLGYGQSILARWQVGNTLFNLVG